MAQYTFDELKTVYESFFRPLIRVEVGKGKNIVEKGFSVISANINISAGFEAGIATLDIVGGFDPDLSLYNSESITQFFLLGNTVEIFAGYGMVVRSVFVGFISALSFHYSEGGRPIIRVTVMDIKGIMMNGKYNHQLAAKDYSGAVKEIFEKTTMKKLTENSIYTLKITDTPDHKEGGGSDGKDDGSIFSSEMVGETDYEFVVRAAKRFNYEFFTVGNTIYFRKARSNKDTLITIGPENMIIDFNVEYNISGVPRVIELRGVDPGKGEVIIGKRNLDYSISAGSKANNLVKGSTYVVQDASVNSTEDVEARLDYLDMELSNRFASLSVECVGLPEYVPGRFIELKELTSEFSKKFYIKTVTHKFEENTGFTSVLEGSAPSL